MGLGAAIVLVAIGAVLRFAVTATITGLDIQVVGDILMGVGAFGLVLWFIFWATGDYRARRTAVIPPAVRREIPPRDDEGDKNRRAA